MSRSRAVWVGTYPTAGPGTPAGRGEGIWSADVQGVRPSVRLVQEVPSPSFLAVHPSRRRVYAVSETAPGRLTVLRPSDAYLTVRSEQPSGGSFPCHLVLDPGARWLFVSHYGDGVVAAFPLDPAGDPGAEPVLLPATGTPGPRNDRQDGPHAHSALVSPDGRFLLVADLGTDELRSYRLRRGRPPEPYGVACLLPPGSGPRHACFRPAAALRRRASSGSAAGPRFATSGVLYVTLELSAEVAVLAWDPDAGTARLVACRAVVPADSTGVAQPSHLLADHDRLLVAVRGPDVVVAFRIRPDGDLAPLAVTPTVAWPRHFALLGEWLVVAGERADALGLHLVSNAREAPGALRHRVPVPTPACIVDGAG